MAILELHGERRDGPGLRKGLPIRVRVQAHFQVRNVVDVQLHREYTMGCQIRTIVMKLMQWRLTRLSTNVRPLSSWDTSGKGTPPTFTCISNFPCFTIPTKKFCVNSLGVDFGSSGFDTFCLRDDKNNLSIGQHQCGLIIINLFKMFLRVDGSWLITTVLNTV